MNQLDFSKTITVSCLDGQLTIPAELVQKWDCPLICDLINTTEVVLEFKTSVANSVINRQVSIMYDFTRLAHHIIENMTFDEYKLIHYLGIKVILNIVRQNLSRFPDKFLIKYFEEWNRDEINCINMLIFDRDLLNRVVATQWLYEIFERQVLQYFQSSSSYIAPLQLIDYIPSGTKDAVIIHQENYDRRSRASHIPKYGLVPRYVVSVQIQIHVAVQMDAIYTKHNLHLKRIESCSSSISIHDDHPVDDMFSYERVDPYDLIRGKALVVLCKYDEMPCVVALNVNRDGVNIIPVDSDFRPVFENLRSQLPLSELHKCHVYPRQPIV